MMRSPAGFLLRRWIAGLVVGIACWTGVNAQTPEPVTDNALSTEAPGARSPAGEPTVQLKASQELSVTQVPAAATRSRAPAPTAASKTTPATETSQALRVVLGLTVLAILPAMLVCLTSFLRIIIVLSMLRHAIGMPETPPNTALIGLALFLTMFTMSPVLQKINADAFEPFMAGRISMEQGY